MKTNVDETVSQTKNDPEGGIPSGSLEVIGRLTL
jgi:hypothetical protein